MNRRRDTRKIHRRHGEVGKELQLVFCCRSKDKPKGLDLLVEQKEQRRSAGRFVFNVFMGISETIFYIYGDTHSSTYRNSPEQLMH